MLMKDDFAKQIDPELAGIFQYLPIMDQPGLDALGFQQRAMEIFAEAAAQIPTPVADPSVEIEDVYIDVPQHRIQLRIYRPRDTGQDSLLPAIFWIHGGGFILGSIEGDDVFCQQLCRNTGCLVASVEYRLVPQYTYPIPVDDCYAGLKWLCEHAEQLGIDLDRVAVAGCSAGGCLAAAVALRARDLQEIKLAAQLLIIPTLDDRCETVSAQTVTEPRVWNRSLSLMSWGAYLQDIEGEVPGYAAPGRAEDLAGLPPAFVSVAELDLLRDEAIDYAQRLMQAGVTTELKVYPGAFHGSYMFAPNAGVSRRQVTDIYAAAKRFFTSR